MRCMSYRNKKLEMIMIITSSNLIVPLHLKNLQRMGFFINIYICYYYLKYDFMKYIFI